MQLLQKQLLRQLSPQTTVQQKIHCSSFDYSHYSVHSIQNHRKPVSLSGRAFTFIHVLISSNLSIRFTSNAIWREPWCREDQVPSSYAKIYIRTIGNMISAKLSKLLFVIYWRQCKFWRHNDAFAIPLLNEIAKLLSSEHIFRPVCS